MKKTTFIGFLSLIILIYFLGAWNIPFMESDSAQHASMAMRMFLEKDYLHIFRGEVPYLDKPHLHFWLSALSFKLFGIGHFTYRIPALIFTFIGAYSTFQLAKYIYDKEVGKWACLMFLTSQAVLLANHDVRTDAVLTGAVIWAMYQMYLYVDTLKFKHAAFGAIALAMAFSSKGMIGVAFSGIPIFCHLLYTKRWKALFNLKLMGAALVFALCISPTLYAYYVQFGEEGIRFILWDQSFNRLNAEGFTETSPDYSFFFHTILWAFLPWAILFYFALINSYYDLFKSKFTLQLPKLNVMAMAGITIVLMIISTSKFKLPHYLNSLFPLMSIFSAAYLYQLEDKVNWAKKTISVFQYIIAVITIVASGLILFFVFPEVSFQVIIPTLGLFILLIGTIFKKEVLNLKLLKIGVCSMLLVNFVLNTHFYPNLLNKYQSGIKTAQKIKELKIDTNHVFVLEQDPNWSLQDYLGQNIKPLTNVEILAKKGVFYVMASQEEYEKLEKQNIALEIISEFDHFRVTRLSGKFLNPKTRNKVLSKKYLFKINER